MNIHLPIDIERVPEYRRLSAVLNRQGVAGSPIAALGLVTRLFIELGYQAQSGAPLGVLTADTVQLLSDDTVSGFCNGGMRALVESGMLRKLDDSDGGFACERFITGNPHHAKGWVDVHRRGWEASRLARSKRKAEEQSVQLSLMIPPDFYKTEDGSKMAPELIDRLLVLINNVDSLLRSPKRKVEMFTETLIRDAYRVVSGNSPESIDQSFRGMLRHRDHPRLANMTTEKLIAQWDDTVRKVAQ